MTAPANWDQPPAGTRWQAVLVGVFAVLACFFLPPQMIRASWTGLIRADDPGHADLAFLREQFQAGDRGVVLLEGPDDEVLRASARLLPALLERPEVGAAIGPGPLFQPPGTHAEGAAAIVFDLRVGTGPEDLDALTGFIEAFRLPQGVERSLGGGRYQERDLARAVRRDQAVTVPTVMVLLLLVSGLLLRSWRSGLVVCLLLGATLLLTMGVQGLLLGHVTTVTALVLTVAAANAMHFVVRHRQDRAAGKDPRTSLGIARAATALAAGTTSVGFLALLVIRIPEFDALALMGALGCLISGACVCFLLPCLLAWSERRAPAASAPLRGLRTVALRDLRQRGPIGRFILLGMLLLGGGSVLLHSETVILDNLPEDDPAIHTAHVLDARLGGSTALELVWSSPSGFDHDEGMARLAQATGHLAARLPAVRSAFSLADALAALQRSDAPRYDAQQRTFLERGTPLGRIPRMLDESGRHARITLAFQSSSTGALLERAAAVEREMAGFVGAGESLRITGAPVLIARATEAVVEGQALACLLSILAVSLLAGVLLRSWRVLPIVWVPNLVPLFALAGVVGLLDWPLSASTAIVGSVVFGLVVDDTLHYLARLKESARPPREAAQITTRRLGPAFVATSLLLMAGGSVAMFGQTEPARVFSVLMVLGVGLALLLDLFVTPRLAAHLRPFRGRPGVGSGP